MFGMKMIRGFSLAELTITVALMLVVVSIAAPPLSTMIKENQLQSQLDKFIITLNFARSEAIKRNQSVVLCPRKTETTCDTVTWENGWLIYADVINPGVLDVPGDTILKQHIALPKDVTLRATNGSAFDTNVTYTRIGVSTASADFVFCDGRGFLGSDTRIITISPTGRATATDNSTIVPPYTDCDGN